jgi:hypothetical protein
MGAMLSKWRHRVSKYKARRVAGQMVARTFHIPDGSWTHDELKAALNQIIGATNQLHLYDHFGACEWGVVKERIRYLAHARGVRLFYFDHVTALAAAFDEERTGLEKMMPELGRLMKELDCWMLFVSHLATPEGKSQEEGGRVMAKHFKGSRAIHAVGALHVRVGARQPGRGQEHHYRARSEGLLHRALERPDLSNHLRQ